jgi:hypothetical protein
MEQILFLKGSLGQPGSKNLRSQNLLFLIAPAFDVDLALRLASKPLNGCRACVCMESLGKWSKTHFASNLFLY